MFGTPSTATAMMHVTWAIPASLEADDRPHLRCSLSSTSAPFPSIINIDLRRRYDGTARIQSRLLTPGSQLAQPSPSPATSSSPDHNFLHRAPIPRKNHLQHGRHGWQCLHPLLAFIFPFLFHISDLLSNFAYTPSTLLAASSCTLPFTSAQHFPPFPHFSLPTK